MTVLLSIQMNTSVPNQTKDIKHHRGMLIEKKSEWIFAKDIQMANNI